MAIIAQKYKEDEFGVAAEYARYLAKGERREMRIYHYAYRVSGGFYQITTSNHEAGENETLIATFHNPFEGEAN